MNLFVFEGALLFRFGLLFKHDERLGLGLLAVRRAGERVDTLRFPGGLLAVGAPLLQKNKQTLK